MKPYRFFFLLTLLALVGLPRSYGQFATWSRSLPPGIATGSITGARSVTDADGNTYVAGQFYAAMTLGPTTLPAAPRPSSGIQYDVFLTKINPSGVIQWAVATRSLRSDAVRAIALDPLGNVFLAIRSDSSNIVGGGNGPFLLGSYSSNLKGTFLAKVSPVGTILTVSSIDTQSSGNVRDLALAPDAAGNCFASVSTDSGYGFGPFTFPSNRSGGIIYRVDAAGVITFVRTLEGTRGMDISDLKVGANGDLYCTGFLAGTSVLGTSPSVTTTITSLFGSYVARFSATGVARWATAGIFPVQMSSDNYSQKLAISATGSVYVAGAAADSTWTLGGLHVGRGTYVVKLSAAGAPQWARTAQTLTSATSDIDFLHLGIDAAGNVYRMSIMNTAAATFGNIIVTHPIPPAPGQTTRTTATYAVSYDSAGTVRWARAANGYVGAAPTSAQRTYLHYDGGMGCDRNGSVYFLLLASVVTTPSRLQFDGELLAVGYHVLRLDPAARLTGTVYVDQNANGTRDAGEVPFPVSQVVEDATLSRVYSSDAATGQYNFYGLANSAYSLTVPSPHRYYTLSAPAVRTGTFPALGQTTTGLDFGLVPGNQTDLSLSLTPYSALRAGFTSRYRVMVENLGSSTVTAATATLTLDPAASYVASTGGGTYSAATRTVAWPVTNLAPFGQVAFDVQFSLPTTAAIGTLIQTSAAVPLASDVDSTNNSAADSRAVSGPYDPNNIQVNYTHLTPAQLAAGLPLDYLIQFQNMGTDTAFTAVIRDTLTMRQLNLGSLYLVAQSHNCTWNLTNNGLLTVRFNNIRLPARTTDVIRSQGFVRFQVQPRSTLTAGEIIPNRAHIFFDYAAPVGTNTATTTVLTPTAILASRAALAWSTYPNPTSRELTVEAELPKAGTVQLQLLDVLGRPVRQQQLQVPAGALRHTLDVQSLAPGLYVLRLTLPDGSSTSRTVVRK